jgi:hypothetical protein
MRGMVARLMWQCRGGEGMVGEGGEGGGIWWEVRWEVRGG